MTSAIAASTRTLTERPLFKALRPDDGLRDVIVLPAEDQGTTELRDTLKAAREMVARMGGVVGRDLKSASGFVARIPQGAEDALYGQGLNVVDDVPLKLFPDPVRRGDAPMKAVGHGITLAGGNSQTAPLGPSESLYSGLGYTGKGVGIAILDSGVAPHPDLQGRIVAFADAVEGRRQPYDSFGHGTHVAGDAAGSGALSNGRFAGPAPEANIIGIRVIGEGGGGRLSDAVDGVVAGIEWMVANKDRLGIRVANLSLGLPLIPARQDFWGRATALYDPIGRAIDTAVAAGICVVAAAGNDGEQGFGTIDDSPAINPNVITVGALDTRGTQAPFDDAVAAFSSRGPTPAGQRKPDVLAPGVNVMSLNSPGSDLEQMNLQAAQFGQVVDQMSDRQLQQMAIRLVMSGMAPEAILYVPIHQLRDALSKAVSSHPVAGRLGSSPAYIGMDGTSMASPIVAGVAAAMIEANPALRPGEVKEILMRTARPLPRADRVEQGAGVIDPQAAVEMAARTRPYPGSRFDVRA